MQTESSVPGGIDICVILRQLVDTGQIVLQSRMVEIRKISRICSSEEDLVPCSCPFLPEPAACSGFR